MLVFGEKGNLGRRKRGICETSYGNPPNVGPRVPSFPKDAGAAGRIKVHAQLCAGIAWIDESMTKRVRALIFVSLAIVGIAVVAITHALAAGESDKAEVMALNQRIVAAYNKRDVGAIMACYSDDPDAIFFEDTIPFQLNKSGASQGERTGFQINIRLACSDRVGGRAGKR